MTISPESLVNREVQVCMSYAVSALARHWGALQLERDDPLADMIEQAGELSAPLDDWEEAAIQAGWSQGGYADGDNGESWNGWFKHDDKGEEYRFATAQEALEAEGDAEPYQREVFEHWAVSQWFGEKLQAKGEKVDFDFAGLVVWARTTTGQGIASDSVVEAIYAELNNAQ